MFKGNSWRFNHLLLEGTHFGSEGFATIWMTMVMVTTTLLSLLPLFPCVHLLVPHKKRKERKTSKKGQWGKICNQRLLEKKRGVLVPFQKIKEKV